MTSHVIKTASDLAGFVKLLHARKLPFTADLRAGAHRTNNQNRLQMMWCKEVSEQLGDRTPNDVRAEAKLTIGVPILRAENEEFRKAYDRIVKPLPYEAKLAIMVEPFDFAVTRNMTTEQLTRYLDEFQRVYAGMGVYLTNPER